jgi:hypothetical protein
MIAVYRGCSRRRTRSISWTTNRAVAERFAHGHRGIPVPDAVIAEALVPKASILAVDSSRGEMEVLLDLVKLPKRLRLVAFAPSGR